MKNMLRLFDILKKYNYILVIYIIFIIIGALLNIVLANTIGEIVDAAISGNLALQIIIYYSLICLLVIFVNFIQGLLNSKYNAYIEEEMYLWITNKVVEKDRLDSIAYKSSYILSLINNDIDKLTSFFSNTFYELLYQPLTFIFAWIYLFFINSTLSLILLPLMLGIVILSLVKSKQITEFSARFQEANTKCLSYEKEALTGLLEINVMNAHCNVLHKHQELTKDVLNKENALNKRIAYNSIPKMVNEYLPKVIVVIIGGWFVHTRTISYGDFAIFIQLLTYISLPMSKYSGTIIEMQSVKASVERIIEFIDSEDEKDNSVIRNPVAQQRYTNETIPIIEFDHVSFSYERDIKVLCDVSFKIMPHDKVVLVGPSGCGKSTILKLIMGFYREYEGNIFINGNELRDMDLEMLRNTISLVDQNFYILPRTISYNITAGKYDNFNQDKDGIAQSARQAQIDTYIKTLPKHYNTLIKKDAKNFSGGQKSKLAIARALYKQSPILLFDEATAALDTKSENNINKIISEFTDKTVLSVSHRASTVQWFERIIVLNGTGQIEETGSFEQLMENKGEFFSMYNIVARKD